MRAIHAIWLQLLALLLRPGGSVDVADLDQFTYDPDGSTEPNVQWPPRKWNHVGCDSLDDCVGWPETFREAIGWKLEANHCEWCPAGSDRCGSHHQSPINLERSPALPDSENTKDCIDQHRMKYYDSSCDFDGLVQHNAFTVERHALKIRQPLEEYEDNKFQIACAMGRAETHRWGRIDFSRGFPEWWYLSHIDFHVPSEHTQEGKRYDAEMQLYHFYSTADSTTGLDNEMGTISIFLEVYDDNSSSLSGDYYMLNKIICQWRRYEENVREQCGLPSVETKYIGCTYFNRTESDDTDDGTDDGTDDNTDDDTDDKAGRARNLRHAATKKGRTLLTAHDLILRNHWRARSNASYVPTTLKLEAHDVAEPEDVDWEELVREVYRQDEAMAHDRHLMDYESVGPYRTYFGMHAVKTEYYFRYSGTQTVPPCYGTYIPGSREQTNHWRVMKDPIRVSQRQIDEMHRLLKERIAPINDPIRPCRPDTAAAPYEGDDTKVNVSRPLMATSKAHFQTFCECQDWESAWREDQAWCELDQRERYFQQPYNFPTEDRF